MESIYQKKDKRLIFKISEDIDECVVQKIRRRADYEIERYIPRKIIFDFNKVSFMDSAGIGLVLGRYKNAVALGAKVEIINVNEAVYKILKMSGIIRLIPVKKEEVATC